MKPCITDLDALIVAAKNLRSAQADFEKRRNNAAILPMDCSPKKRQVASSSVHSAAMEVERLWDVLHAAAVDLGLSEAKPESFYQQHIQYLSSFHNVAYQPAIPRIVKECLTTGTQPEPRTEVTAFADNDERDEFIRACQDFDDDGETGVDYGLLMKWANAGLLDCDHFTITKKGRSTIDAARAGDAS